MIPVTKPFLPSKHEYNNYISQIWGRNWLTNNGPLVNELELRLKRYLRLDHLLFTSNGTVAIQLAIKALSLTGEVITTPFSYVATTSTICWENCVPIFADIDEKTWNISPSKIEACITEKTSAILATHVFGNPCDVENIENIAKNNNLKVIYDAAHCFGVNYKGESIFNYGDISTTSFHATKLFHTVEGGAIITKSPELLKQMSYLRNFGHNGPEKFASVGINAKNSEFHAAMGLCVMSYIEKILSKRKEQYLFYLDKLKDLGFNFQVINEQSEYNYAYFPIVFNNEEELIFYKKILEDHRINPRRYFYPSLNLLPYLDRTPTPVSEKLASCILCLPIYHEMTKEVQEYICRILIRSNKYGK